MGKKPLPPRTALPVRAVERVPTRADEARAGVARRHDRLEPDDSRCARANAARLASERARAHPLQRTFRLTSTTSSRASWPTTCAASCRPPPAGLALLAAAGAPRLRSACSAPDAATAPTQLAHRSRRAERLSARAGRPAGAARRAAVQLPAPLSPAQRAQNGARTRCRRFVAVCARPTRSMCVCARRRIAWCRRRAGAPTLKPIARSAGGRACAASRSRRWRRLCPPITRPPCARCAVCGAARVALSDRRAGVEAHGRQLCARTLGRPAAAARAHESRARHRSGRRRRRRVRAGARDVAPGALVGSIVVERNRRAAAQAKLAATRAASTSMSSTQQTPPPPSSTSTSTVSATTASGSTAGAGRSATTLHARAEAAGDSFRCASSVDSLAVVDACRAQSVDDVGRRRRLADCARRCERAQQLSAFDLARARAGRCRLVACCADAGGAVVALNGASQSAASIAALLVPTIAGVCVALVGSPALCVRRCRCCRRPCVAARSSTRCGSVQCRSSHSLAC